METVARALNDLPLWSWPVMLGAMGAVLGSFIAALVIRMPQGRSVLIGRSRCDCCDAVLGPVDLVPLFGALAARGRCRHCREPINPLHWQIELAAVLIGVAAGAAIAGPLAVVASVFGWMLLALAVLDLTEFWLPDRLTLSLAVVGLGIGVFGAAPPSLADRLIGGAAGFAALWAIGAAYKAYRGVDGLGGGDPKLFGAIGLWLGWRMLPMVLVLAGMAGLGIVMFWMLTGRGARRDDRLAFGALMAIAAYPTEVAMLSFLS